MKKNLGGEDNPVPKGGKRAKSVGVGGLPSSRRNEAWERGAHALSLHAFFLARRKKVWRMGDQRREHPRGRTSEKIDLGSLSPRTNPVIQQRFDR